jgi:preprotein translocase subunit SecE
MVAFFQKLRIFIRETLIELRKATWPTKIELRESVIVVLFAAFVLGFTIFVSDFSFFQLVTMMSHIAKPT